jgi:protein-disulfide isomerase
MKRLLVGSLSLGLLSLALAPTASAQTSLPPNQVSLKGDTSLLKPPPGVKVAVLEWEDLECPACAHAFPFVHTAVAQYKIPLIRHDFQIPGHIWSHEASLYARYLQDKVSPDLATDYRRQVFASQFRIGSRDDLNKFTQQFFTSHGKQLPFVLDPTGQLGKEVDADRDMGIKIGLMETPTIVVVTNKGWIQVKDVSELDKAIDEAEASVAETPHKK